MTSSFLIFDSFLIENLIVWSLFRNDDFLEFIGIKFETNKFDYFPWFTKNKRVILHMVTVTLTAGIIEIFGRHNLALNFDHANISEIGLETP